MTEYHLGSTILTLQPGVRAGRMFIDSRQALRGDITAVDPRVNATYRFLTPTTTDSFTTCRSPAVTA